MPSRRRADRDDAEEGGQQRPLRAGAAAEQPQRVTGVTGTLPAAWSSSCPSLDADHPVGQRHHHRVVGGHQRGDALGLHHPAQQRHHRQARLGVQLPGRLVGDQQPGRAGQGPGDRHPLLLAAGQLARPLLGVVGQADQVQQQLDPTLALRRRGRGPAAAARRRSPRPTAPGSARTSGTRTTTFSRRSRDRPSSSRAVTSVPSTMHRAGVRAVQAADDVEQGGLARAGPADERRPSCPAATSNDTSRRACTAVGPVPNARGGRPRTVHQRPASLMRAPSPRSGRIVDVVGLQRQPDPSGQRQRLAVVARHLDPAGPVHHGVLLGDHVRVAVGVGGGAAQHLAAGAPVADRHGALHLAADRGVVGHDDDGDAELAG